jgi:protease-4
MLGLWCLVVSPVFSQVRYLEINLNNQGIGFMVQSRRTQSLLEVFRVIEKAGKDTTIRGIVLNISKYQADKEYLWELRTALEAFKAQNKKICAFISSADLDTYYLASVADSIVMDEQGSLMFFGYAYGRGFVQHTLEKLGVGVRELRYLEYKSAAETYTRDSLSGADKIQYGAYLDSIFNLTKETITRARSLTASQFDVFLNDDFVYSSKAALEKGLVDKTGRMAAVQEAVKELEGKDVKHWALWGGVYSSVMGNKTPPYSAGGKSDFLGLTPKIAVVYALGNTDLERGMRARSIAGIIRELSLKRSVKAIVVRINSPGGSSEAADYVAEAIKEAKEKMPVVVSMGSVAASGGYWAAMYADHIVVSPYTLTGSIGVIGSWFFDQGLNDKLGLTVDLISRGKHADLMAGVIIPHRDLTDEEEARFRAYILDMYGDFVARAAVGRNMERDRLESLARGRVYSGQDALTAGLVDSLGGLADAVKIARGLAKIPAAKRVICDEYPKPKFMDNLRERLFASLAAAGIPAALDLPAVSVLNPEAAPAIEEIRFRMSRNGQALVMLPLNLTP